MSKQRWQFLLKGLNRSSEYPINYLNGLNEPDLLNCLNSMSFLSCSNGMNYFNRIVTLFMLSVSLLLPLTLASEVTLQETPGLKAQETRVDGHQEAGILVSKLRYQDKRYVDVTLDLSELSLMHYWQDPQTASNFGSFHNLKKYLHQENELLLFAINSGIYTKEYKPLGLHIENSKLLMPLNMVKSNEGQGNFSLLPNGVFYITQQNRAYVMDSDRFQARFNGDYQGIKDAVQSGPMLLTNGQYNPHFIKDSDSLRIRSGVCAMNEGREVHFVVTEDAVNFYDFATYFKERLVCQNALYLDGTLARIYIDGRMYGASFWQVKPLVGIWSVSRPYPTLSR